MSFKVRQTINKCLPWHTSFPFQCGNPPLQSAARLLARASLSSPPRRCAARWKRGLPQHPACCPRSCLEAVSACVFYPTLGGGGFFQCILSFALPPTNIAPGNGKAEPSIPSRWQTWLPVAPVAEVPNGQKTLMERSADTSRTRGKLHQLHQRSTHAARLALAGAPGVDAPGGRRSSGQGRPLPLATAGPVRLRARCSGAHLDLGAQRASRSCARSLGEGTYRFQAACVDLRSIWRVPSKGASLQMAVCLVP